MRDGVLDEILFELGERGSRLKGNGPPQVIWSGQTLDFSSPLPSQGVRANDILRVSEAVITALDPLREEDHASSVRLQEPAYR